jgi:hypothetical protein
MADIRGQNTCIKFCVKLGKMAIETHEMLKSAFREDYHTYMRRDEWFPQF